VYGKVCFLKLLLTSIVENKLLKNFARSQNPTTTRNHNKDEEMVVTDDDDPSYYVFHRRMP
jgi:hypothetical protein